MIKPTIGRVVWFWTSAAYADAPGSQPNAALVCWVWDDYCLNIIAFDCNGDARPQHRVPLLQDGEGRPKSGPFCEWMPYQKEQAAKQFAPPPAQDPIAVLPTLKTPLAPSAPGVPPLASSQSTNSVPYAPPPKPIGEDPSKDGTGVA